jgi:hypothetical protein
MTICQSEWYLHALDMTVERALSYWIAIYSYILQRQFREVEPWLFAEYDEVLSGRGLTHISNTLGADADFSFVDESLRRSPPQGELPIRAQALYETLLDLAGRKYR